MIETPPPKLLKEKPQTLDAFLEGRGWPSEVIGTPGLRVLSHLLTYPLTLGYLLEHIIPQEKPCGKWAYYICHPSINAPLPQLPFCPFIPFYSPSNLPGPIYVDTFSIGVLGARAEASLPPLWWNEVIYMCGGDEEETTTTGRRRKRNLPTKHLHLHMVGPEIPGSSGNNKSQVVPLPLKEEGEGGKAAYAHLPEIVIDRQNGFFHKIEGK